MEVTECTFHPTVIHCGSYGKQLLHSPQHVHQLQPGYVLLLDIYAAKLLSKAVQHAILGASMSSNKGLGFLDGGPN